MRTRWLGLIAVGVITLVAGAESATTGNLAPESHDSEFQAFLKKINEAQIEFVQGRPAPFKALWSHGPDVTIFGGFGSGEQGWDKVGPRLDWASAQFLEGSRSHEVLSTHASGDFGYVVQREKIRFKTPGRSKASLLELRATMIMRREPEGWRIVHRHADSQITKQAP